MKKMGLILFYLIFLSLTISAQLIDDRDSIEVLIFEHLEKEDMRFIRTGGTIKYKLRSNPKVSYSGELENISTTSMYVDGQKVMLADCKIIKGRVRTDKEMIGGILAGFGFAGSGFGGAFAGTSSLSAGLPILGVGLGSLGSGISMMMSKKSFNMDKGWSVYGGKMIFDRAAQ
ncbi:MAG: hypothetical protein MK212_03720 [Saprospiraceae bacterium]|nr:hypothetical protein [Saprospiraceae bacterium]